VGRQSLRVEKSARCSLFPSTDLIVPPRSSAWPRRSYEETEIWPNLLRECRRSRLLVPSRDDHTAASRALYRSYRLIRPLCAGSSDVDRFCVSRRGERREAGRFSAPTRPASRSPASMKFDSLERPAGRPRTAAGERVCVLPALANRNVSWPAARARSEKPHAVLHDFRPLKTTMPGADWQWFAPRHTIE